MVIRKPSKQDNFQFQHSNQRYQVRLLRFWYNENGMNRLGGSS